jgi:ATP synthase protein I
MPQRAENPNSKLPESAERLMHEVGVRQARMVRRKKEGPPNVWRSVGMVGLVGWSVVLPMLIGVAVGLWVDRQWPSRFSWTLMLLVGGLGVGCANAWNRIRREQEDR